MQPQAVTDPLLPPPLPPAAPAEGSPAGWALGPVPLQPAWQAQPEAPHELQPAFAPTDQPAFQDQPAFGGPPAPSDPPFTPTLPWQAPVAVPMPAPDPVAAEPLPEPPLEPSPDPWSRPQDGALPEAPAQALPGEGPWTASRLPPSADRLPTLTEVLELGPERADLPTAPELLAAVVALPPLDQEALVRRVMADLAPRIDSLFEARLREALAPALARAADGLIRDARSELMPALTEIVSDAVTRALEGPRQS